MGFSQDQGYIPVDIETIMRSIMGRINTEFGTSYTYETFVGTNFYKYFYAAAQELQVSEVKTSEIFAKLQQYFDIINARISRPVVTNPGIVEKLSVEGYVASVKPMIDADAGKIHICVDVDDGVHATGNVEITDYAALVSGDDDTITIGETVFTAQETAATLGTDTFQAATSNAATAESLALQINSHAVAGLLVRAVAVGAIVNLTARQGGVGGNAIDLIYTDNDTNPGATVSAATLEDGEDNEDYPDIREEICTLISQITVGGTVTQGTESEAIVLSNGQSFDFKYNLPNRLQVWLRLSINISENNQFFVESPDYTKDRLLDNISEKYKLGKNFEPQRYFSILDAPWASDVLLEYSFDYDPLAPESATWSNAVYDSEYDELFEIALARIILVEA
jgi:hypothetical protein